MNYIRVVLSISLFILSPCAEMAMLDKIKVDKTLGSLDSVISNTETITKTRLYNCAHKEKNGKVYRCTKYKYRIPSLIVTRKDTVLAFANLYNYCKL